MPNSYTIKQGDTLEQIGKKYNIPYLELARLNKIKDPNKIFAGQTLNLPVSVQRNIDPRYRPSISPSGVSAGYSASKPSPKKSAPAPIRKVVPQNSKPAKSSSPVPFYLNPNSVKAVAQSGNWDAKETIDPKYAFNKTLIRGNYLARPNEQQLLDYTAGIWNDNGRPIIQLDPNRQDGMRSYFQQNKIKLKDKQDLLEELSHSVQYTNMGDYSYNKRANLEKERFSAVGKDSHYHQPGTIENEAHGTIAKNLRGDVLLNTQQDFLNSLPADQRYAVTNDIKKFGHAIITDKGTNETIVVATNNDNSITAKKFPVLTGQNYNQDNTYPMSQLDSNPALRGTPTGTFPLRPKNIYGKPGYSLDGGEGVSYHTTYPGELEKRSPLYNKSAKDRRASYGCINCRPDDLKSLYPIYNNSLNPLVSTIVRQYGGSVPTGDYIFASGGQYAPPTQEEWEEQNENKMNTQEPSEYSEWVGTGNYDYNPYFKAFNTAAMGLTGFANAFSDAKQSREEQERYLKELMPKPKYNYNEQGLNNIPVYKDGGDRAKKMFKILRDGEVNGKPLTKKQKKFFFTMATKKYPDGGSPSIDDLKRRYDEIVYGGDGWNNHDFDPGFSMPSDPRFDNIDPGFSMPSDSSFRRSKHFSMSGLHLIFRS